MNCAPCITFGFDTEALTQVGGTAMCAEHAAAALGHRGPRQEHRPPTFLEPARISATEVREARALEVQEAVPAPKADRPTRP